jgi:retron-type reverse transcriptase
MAPLSLYSTILVLHGLLGTLQLVGFIGKYGLGKVAWAAIQLILPLAYLIHAECLRYMKAAVTTLNIMLFMSHLPTSILYHTIAAAAYTAEHAQSINAINSNASLNSSKARRKKINKKCKPLQIPNPSSDSEMILCFLNPHP